MNADIPFVDQEAAALGKGRVSAELRRGGPSVGVSDLQQYPPCSS